VQRIPVGVSNFQEIRTDNYYFVDKSMLIADVVRGGAEVTLLRRPGRFGKTLNLNMLKTFFTMGSKDNGSLFQGLTVHDHEDVMAHCGVYSVIYLTFKDVKYSQFDHCYSALKAVLGSLYQDHEATLDAANPKELEKKRVEAGQFAKRRPCTLQLGTRAGPLRYPFKSTGFKQNRFRFSVQADRCASAKGGPIGMGADTDQRLRCRTAPVRCHNNPCCWRGHVR